jgi:hypothetical protein
MDPVACPSCGEPLVEVEFCYHSYETFILQDGVYQSTQDCQRVPPTDIRCASCEEWLPKEIADAVYKAREQ